MQLSVLAYNLGNLWRRLGLPQRIKNWSLTSLQHRLMKTGGRLIKHARYYWLLFAGGHLNRRLFGDIAEDLVAACLAPHLANAKSGLRTSRLVCEIDGISPHEGQEGGSIGPASAAALSGGEMVALRRVRV